MYKRCEAKHYNGKFNGKSFSKMTVIIILLILLALNSMGGILAYLTSRASATNNITIAGLYTVHYNSNEGTGTMPDQTMAIGKAENLAMNSFIKDGYEFIGWNTLPGGTGTSYANGESVTDLTNVDYGEVTLYAQWRPGAYNITYNLGGGTVATSNPASYTEETQTFTLNNPTKPGYNFIGWSGTDLIGNTNTTVTIPQGSTGDRSYTAHYTPITYYMRFNANGGTGTMANQEMTYDTSANLTANSYENPAYVFTEWTTEQDGTGRHFSDRASVANLATTDGAIIDLYAQWEDERYVAEVVGDKKYSTLSAAVNAVEADGVQRTIKLLKNYTLPGIITIAQNKNIVFDFQYFTLSNSKEQVIKNNGTLEFIRGTIESSVAYGAIDNNASGTFIVSGGRIITTGERQAIYNNGGIVEVTGDSYLCSSASDRATIQNHKPDNGRAGTITISGGQIISAATTTRGAIENEATGTVIITGGTVTSNNAMGVDNKGTLTIGEKGGGVDITSPVIQGATYGVTTNNNLTVNFYDGIIKGKTNAFNNENYITDIEVDHNIVHSTEDIDGDIYQTAYLGTAKVKVIFDAGPGTTDESVRFVDSNSPVGTLPTATRPRYRFDGWFTDPHNGRQIDATEIITGRTTFYAYWTQTEALVTFNANGGTPTETTQTVTVGSSVQSLPTVTQQYKTFIGWFTDPTAGTQIDGTEIITQDTTYYAHWNSIPVEVTFNANGGYIGDVDETELIRNLSAGDVLGSLPIPTRPDYVFSGWFTDPNSGTRIDGTEVITQDETYYAHWMDGFVAQIGDVKYETLQAAVNAVPTDNTETTITVVSDILEAIDVAANKNIVLDLQNHTLYNDGTKTVGTEQVVIRNRGTIKISNGTITADTQSATINNELGGRLIITGGNIIQTGTGNKKNKQAIYNNGGAVEISGNAYITASNSGSYNSNERGVIQNLNYGSSAGTLIITGGTIESSTGPGIVNQASGNQNYSNTVIIGTKDGIVDPTTPVIIAKNYGVRNNGIFNFYDGIVKGRTDSISGTINDNEDGASRVNTTETIGGNSYHVTYFE